MAVSLLCPLLVTGCSVFFGSTLVLSSGDWAGCREVAVASSVPREALEASTGEEWRRLTADCLAVPEVLGPGVAVEEVGVELEPLEGAGFFFQDLGARYRSYSFLSSFLDLRASSPWS